MTILVFMSFRFSRLSPKIEDSPIFFPIFFYTTLSYTLFYFRGDEISPTFEGEIVSPHISSIFLIAMNRLAVGEFGSGEQRWCVRVKQLGVVRRCHPLQLSHFGGRSRRKRCRKLEGLNLRIGLRRANHKYRIWRTSIYKLSFLIGWN